MCSPKLLGFAFAHDSLRMRSLYRTFANPASMANLLLADYHTEYNLTRPLLKYWILVQVVLNNTFLVHVGQIREFYRKSHTAIKR